MKTPYFVGLFINETLQSEEHSFRSYVGVLPRLKVITEIPHFVRLLWVNNWQSEEFKLDSLPKWSEMKNRVSYFHYPVDIEVEANEDSSVCKKSKKIPYFVWFSMPES